MARFSLKPLPEGTAIVINKPLFVGTEPDSDLVLQPGYSSRRHALIKLAAGSVSLEDLGSKNGTFINEKRLPRGVETRLKPGDQIRFARQKFEFCDAGPEPPRWIDEEQRDKGGSDTVPVDDESGKRIENHGRAGDVDQPCLEVISGARTGERIALRDVGSGRTEWKVGSKEDLGVGKQPNFLVLSEEGVSEEHAKISLQGTHWAVDDLLAKNGTFVNGNRTMRSYLNSEDQIAFGPVVCIFKLPNSKGRCRHDETQTDIPPFMPGRWAALLAWLRRLLGGRA
jgi:pSer/pThr/pTyr-binding forkhead associated (FHA) protein